MFTVIETKQDWSSGYYGILYCLKTVCQCADKYTMFQLRRDMRNKLNDISFMKKLKSSLKILSNVDDNFYKKDCSKESLTALKKNIYVKEMEKRIYLTKEHKFDDKLCLTVLSLMHEKLLFIVILHLILMYSYTNLILTNSKTVIIRTRIYENSIPGINIFLMKKPTNSMFNAHNKNSGNII